MEKSSGKYYWFSPGGAVLAETDTSGNTQNEYIYFTGGRTARLLTNASGTVCYDADITPFGQELAYTATCSQNYKFTGMERDTETGNDHSLYRGYESGMGRWMSPDPAGLGTANRHSWNRFS